MDALVLQPQADRVRVGGRRLAAGDVDAVAPTFAAAIERGLLPDVDTSVVVDMQLGALGGLMTVLGGGPGGDWAPGTWRETPDFWKDIA